MLTCCNLSNDGRRIVLGTDLFKELYIYDLNSGDVIQQIRGTLCMLFTYAKCQQSVYLQLDDYFGSGCDYGNVSDDDHSHYTNSNRSNGSYMYNEKLRDISAVCFISEFHKNSLTFAMFTPDDTRVITTSADKTAKFYDLRSDTCTIKLE